MAKYQVAFQSITMVYVTVEASDPEEAIDLAYEQEQDYTLDIGDSWDVYGEPEVIA